MYITLKEQKAKQSNYLSKEESLHDYAEIIQSVKPHW